MPPCLPAPQCTGLGASVGSTERDVNTEADEHARQLRSALLQLHAAPAMFLSCDVNDAVGDQSGFETLNVNPGCCDVDHPVDLRKRHLVSV
jgi:hypothetical protein